MTQKYLQREAHVVEELKQAVREKPAIAEVTVDFKRDWAYGNAGLENESITEEQVKKVITK